MPPCTTSRRSRPEQATRRRTVFVAVAAGARVRPGALCRLDGAGASRDVSNSAQFWNGERRSQGVGRPNSPKGRADEPSAPACSGRGTRRRTVRMTLSGEGLLIILLVGLIAGWLAGQIVQGTGFGLLGDLLIGIVGALIGSWLLPQLGIHLGTGLVAAIVNATIGALILLLIIKLVRGGGRFGGGWGWRRRW